MVIIIHYRDRDRYNIGGNEGIDNKYNSIFCVFECVRVCIDVNIYKDKIVSQ